MNQDPVFSIVIPTFNRGHILLHTLESVAAQSYRPLEVIIVDDGSTDNTSAVVEDWQKNLNDDTISVSYFKNENGGVAKARNFGVSQTTGQWIQFLDSDDTLYPSRLEILAETFTHTKADLIQTGFEGKDLNTGEITQTMYGRLKNTVEEQILMGVFWPNTLRVAFTAGLVKRMGPWNESMTGFEDREYVERAVIHSEKAICIRDILAVAGRNTGGNITDSLKTYNGRRSRLVCEEQIINNLDQFKVNANYKQLYINRMFTFATRLYGEGWDDLGDRMVEILNSTKVRGLKTKLKSALLNSGPRGKKAVIAVYKLIQKIKA